MLRALLRFFTGTPRRQRRHAVVEECEPRILYSADLNPALWADAGSAAEVRLVASPAAAPAAAAAAVQSPAEAQRRSHEIVFVDANVPDAQTLIDAVLAARGAQADIEIVRLAGDADGLQQITDVLAGERGLDAIHIISHGSAGQLQLGSGTVDERTLQQRADELRLWRNALGDEADLLIYGCDVAAGEAGQAFVYRLAEMTGTDVAASVDVTGAQAAGGNWDLEARSGPIESAAVLTAAIEESWSHTLPVAVNSTTTNQGTGSSITVPHTTAGSNRLMLVGIALGTPGATTVTGLTYNGVALTRVGFDTITVTTDTARVELWGLVAPSLGTFNLVASFSGAMSNGATVGVTSFTGVDQSAPLSGFVSATGTNSSPALSIASAPGELVFSTVGVDSATNYNFTPGGSQTELWDLFQVWSNGAASTQAGLSTTNVSWSISSANEWALGAVAVKPVNTAPVLDNTRSPVMSAQAEDSGLPVGAVGTLVSALVDFAAPAGQVDNVTDPDTSALLGMAVTAADTASGTWWYSTNGGTNWNALGAVANSNARLLAADASTRLYFQPNANYNGTLANAITFRAWDRTSGSNGALADTTTNGGTTASSAATDVASLTISAVNDAPTLGNGTLVSVAEDTVSPAGATVSTIFSGQFADIDSGSSMSGIAVVGNTANAGTQGAWQYSSNGGTNWFAIGTVADNSTALAISSSSLIRFVPVANYNGTPTALTVRGLDNSYVASFSATAGSESRVTVNTTTPGGATAIAAATANLSTTITAVNDAPVNALPANAYTALNTARTFSTANGNALQISDADAASGTMQFTLTATQGTLSLSSTAGLTLTAGSNGSSTFTYTGTLSAINTAMGAGVTFTPTNGFRGLAQLTLQSSDLGNSGSGGALTDSDTLNLHVGAIVVTTTNDTSNGTTTSITNLLANDGGDGVSLREAIAAANATAGTDHISFNIALGAGGFTGTNGVDGRWIITLASALPQITDSVIIDATTQTSAVANSNPGVLGTGGTVGADGLALGTVNRPEIEIVGSASTATAFNVAANNVTVRGFAIRGVGSGGSDAAIFVGNNFTGTLIEQNVLGSSATAFADPGAGLRNFFNININGADSGTIQNNLSGFSFESSILFENTSSNWLVENNEIRDSALQLNAGDGIGITGGSAITLQRNLITGAASQGIAVAAGATNLTLVNNTVTNNGIGIAGTTPSQSNAIVFRSTVSAVTVDRNVISGNYGAGLAVNSGATGIRLTQNAIFNNGTILSRNGSAATGQIGIDLNAAGDDINLGTAPFVSANDAGDADAGGNNLQNFPVLATARTNASNQLILTGTLNSAVNSFYRIEFFASTSQDGTGHGEGQTYLGFVNVATDGSGNAAISTTLAANVAVGSFISATATRSVSDYTTFTDTSEFARNVAAVSSTQATVTVTTTSDTSDGDTTSISTLLANMGADGFISLREAITAANNTANGSGADRITFNIAGTGVHTITPLTALPTISNAVILDATTDDSFAANGSRPAVILDGNNLAADGLVLSSTADGSTIRGFVIRDFGGDGIEIQTGSDGNTIAGNYIGRLTATGADAGAAESNTGSGINLLGSSNTIGGATAADRNVIAGNADGIYLQGASGNVIVGNYIGTDGTGLIDLGNSDRGIQIESGANNTTIGGTTAAARNVISGNDSDGIIISDGAIPGTTTTGTIVQGNYIGVGADGVTVLGNTTNGIRITTESNHTIGGVAAGAGNVIAHNAMDGVLLQNATAVNNRILGNSIFSNGGEGIDLGNNGVTANDLPASLDSDSGANNLQNFPVLTSALINGAQITIAGSLNSSANGFFRIEFYASTAGDGTGHGEGQTYLGFANVATNGSGNATINAMLSASVSAGAVISATATRSDSLYSAFTDTSEFAQNVVATVAPVLTTTGTTLAYTENGAATAVDSALTVSDADSTNLTGATVTISANYVNGQDTLAFTNQLGITGSWNAGSGVLTLSGTTTVANYQTALRSITYLNTSDDPSTATRTVSFVVNDGVANSNTGTRNISVTAVNDAPLITTTGTTLAYTENGAATAVDSALTVSDADSTNLTGATVTISANYANGQDTLAFTNQLGITGSWNAGSGVLTLSGTTTVANYQTALRSITYLNTSDNPSTATRTVSFVVNDGVANSNTATRNISVAAVNDAPVLATGSTLAYTENQAATAINTAITVADVDSTTLASATVQITVNYASGQDVLAFTNVGMGNIAGVWNPGTGTITLTSAGATATLAQWQAAVRAVTYANSSDNPSTAARTVSYTVNDGAAASNTVTSTVNITAVNDAPVLATGSTLAYTENQAATAINTAITVADVDSTTLASATVQITVNYASGQDVLAFTNVGMGNIAGVWNPGTGTITLTSAGATATLAQWQAAVRAVTYANSSDNPSTAARTVSYQVNDGATASNTVTSTVNITAANDAPVVTTTGTTLAYTENGGATAVDGGLTVSDVDSANLAGATVTISANYANGQDTLAFTDQNGISGSWNSGTGVLTLSGSATVANYQAALRSITYVNTSDNPSTTMRTVSFVVNDGSANSNTGTRNISVAAVNDAPTGGVAIDDTTPTQGQTLTASNTLADLDGLGAITYQWQRGGVDIVGATGATYTTTQTDVGSTLRVVASYTDGQGTPESVASANTAAVANVNDAPTGSVTIDDTTPTQGQTLTASNSLADLDGLGVISYQWQRGGVNIVGATGATYVTSQADVGSVLRVVASYTDGQGTSESVASANTAVVANVNDAPTGSVTIDDTTPTQGQTLTASNTLVDADGLGVISYQWQRAGVDIAGATGATYVTSQADVGSMLRVVASYTDGQGTPESVASANTAAVANVNDAPTGSVTIDDTTPTQGQTLTASNTLADVDGLGVISYQWQRGGVNIVGATGATYVTSQADVGFVLRVVASYTDGQGTPESVASANTAAVANVNDAPTGSVTIDDTTPTQGQTLTASNSLADIDGLGVISYQWQRGGVNVVGATGATYVTSQADVGSMLRVVASYTDGQGTPESVASANTAAVANVNDAPTGSVTIDDTTPTQGQTLTASNSLADLDGLGVISYQWQRGGVNIVGATGATYVTSQADVGSVLRVVASYTDGQGTSESVASANTAVVANVNDAPTGSVTIDDTTPTQGQTLTASNTLVDADGLGVISYQWQRAGVDIAGATGATYVTSQADVGSMLRVVASYTDGQGTPESVASANTAAVANVNDAPTGSVTIDDTTPTQGQTLTASNTLADVDGLGVISYQWQRGGVNIVGATGATYVTSQADVGFVLRVVASYTDGQGTPESVASANTAAVANVNDAPTGSVTIDDTTPTQGQTLTASNSLADIDGLGVISYQWQRGGVNVVGATGATYVTSQADVGSMLRVVASYTDGQGTPESVASANTAAVANVNDAPTGSVTIDDTTPTQGQTLTASNSLADIDGLGVISYQWQRGGVNIVGATSATYVTSQADVGSVLRVVASYTDGQGTPESVASANTAAVVNVNDAPTGSVTIDDTTPTQGQTLTASNTLADVDGLGAITYQWQRGGVDIVGATGATYVTSQADVGSVLRVVASYTDGQGTPESVASANTAAVANVNDAPTGSVTIDDTTPTQGQTLTASNSLADLDGLGVISYQWQRGGVNVVGATGATYVTSQADVGSMLRVVASYTDGQGTPESVASANTAAVANVNDAPTGSVTIDDTTPTQGQTLTASNSLADIDGLGVISYQWQRGGVNVVGATGATYVTSQADVGSMLRVVASYTDGQGTPESVASANTAAVSNVNDAPTGSVTIDDTTPTQGQTLTASNSLADIDGLGVISYQWQRGGVNIVGATGATYVTSQADVGSVLRVVASYTDGQGTSESVTSANTAAVVNVNDAPTGSVTIDDTTPTQGQTLTASNTLADVDGLGAITYQWQRGGVNIVGATSATYVTSQADVGSVLRVVASYTDGQGTPESVASANTAAVANVNDAPTGSVTIDDTTPTQGQTLTASNSLADIDGLGVISYQWQRGGVNVVGATGATYVTSQADVGSMLRVVASYTDGQGTPESVASANTAAVANVNDAPTGSVTIDDTTPTQGQTLTASNSLADIDGLGVISYQWQRGGVDIVGATSATYVTSQADVGSTLRVVASYIDGQGTPESVASANTADVANVNDAPTGSVTIDDTTPTQGQTLTASNSLADIDGLGVISYQWQRAGVNIVGATSATYVTSQADVGSVLGVVASYTDGQGTPESVASANTAAVANVNDAPTGSVTIDDTTPTQGQTLTASNTLADVDGLGVISYQWQRGGVNIVGATGATYVTSQADVGFVLRVVASYTDGQGTPESVASANTAAVANVNDAPTGSVTIDDTTPTQGQTLTASNSLADIDGLGVISYQWQRGGVDIVGATSATYVTSQADVGSTLRVVASYIDGQGTPESVASANTADVANVNDAPTGSVTIDDTTPTQGQTLTASNSLADIDGLGVISYQWQRGGVNVVGATGATYVTSQADVGSVLRVVASYTDGQGTPESVASANTAAVSNVNDAPTGSVTIDDTTPTQGQTLTASNTLVDADGLGVISYQWQRGGVNIVGATGATYVTSQADVGSVLRVVASYTDGQGTSESVTSANTAAVANVNDAPTGSVTIDDTTPTQGQTLTASNSLADIDGLGVISYQWQRGGVDIVGATSATYVTSQADVGSTLRVVASYIDGQGTPESVASANTAVVANVNDAPTGSVTIDDTTPTQGQTLTASNSLADIDGLGVISYQWQRGGVNIVGATGATYVTSQADVGFVLRVVASYTDGQGTPESVASANTAAVANVNDAPTGSVTIDDTTPTQGQTLTASNSLADIDGLGVISYQWQRGGVNVVGATGATYVTSQADVGSVLRVVASYTDGQGTPESVASASTAAVSNVNDAPTGSVTIDDTTPTQGQTLTASSTLVDADGLGAISYQWQRGGVDVVGATGGTYITSQADVGSVLRVVASYTDSQGTPETVASANPAAVANVNDARTGSVTIDDPTPTQGQTLTATSTLADLDGLGAITYQWQRGDVDIVGATGATYVTSQADVGSVLRVVASYTDGQGTPEAMASGATAAVARVNDVPMLGPPPLPTGLAPAPAPTPAVPAPAPAPASAPATESAPPTTSAPDNAAEQPPSSAVAVPPTPGTNLAATAVAGEPLAQAAPRADTAAPTPALPEFVHGSVSFDLIALDLTPADLPTWRLDVGNTLEPLVFRNLTQLRFGHTVELDPSPILGQTEPTDGAGGLDAALSNPISVSGVGVTAGFVWWLTRAGGLMTAVLMGVPAWRHVDLLPVLARADDDDEDEEDAEGADTTLKDSEIDVADDLAVADLFDHRAAPTRAAPENP